LVAETPTLDEFRAKWIDPDHRHALLAHLIDAGLSPSLIRTVDEMNDYDLYDVLGELGYGLDPRTRTERAEAFNYKHGEWLHRLPPPAAQTLRAIAAQFARAGTEGLENPLIFRTDEVRRAGGLDALRAFGRPSEILQQAKQRIFAA